MGHPGVRHAGGVRQYQNSVAVRGGGVRAVGSVGASTNDVATPIWKCRIFQGVHKVETNPADSSSSSGNHQSFKTLIN